MASQSCHASCDFFLTASQSCHAPVPPGKSSTSVSKTIKALSLSPDPAYHSSHQSPKMPAAVIQKTLWKKNKLIVLPMKVGDTVSWSAGVKARYLRSGPITEIIDQNLFVFQSSDGPIRARPRGVYAINDKHVSA